MSLIAHCCSWSDTFRHVGMSCRLILLGPGNGCLQLYLLLLFFFRHGSLWQPIEPIAGKLFWFDILIEDSPNIKYTNFCVSKSFPLAPPPVQSFTFILLITFEPFGQSTKFFFPLISELMPIRLHPMTSFFVIIIFPPF